MSEHSPLLSLKIIQSKIVAVASRILWGSFLQFRYDNEKYSPKFKLNQKHIKNLKILLDRQSLLKVLPKKAICAEIGVDKGDFSKLILMETRPQKLHLIDAWGDSKRYTDGLKEFVKNRFKKEIKKGSIEVNVGYSTKVLKVFPDRYFDWVYLDTNHTYENTAKELKILKDKVKLGGIISGHDFIIGNWRDNFSYGVIEAVHEFCVKNNWQLVYITEDFDESPSFAIRRINMAKSK